MALCLNMLLCTTTLSSQSVHITSDTSWIFTFYEQSDSILNSIELHSNVDSANTTTDIRMSLDPTTFDTLSGDKYYYNFNSFGKSIQKLRYGWNSLDQSWYESQIDESTYDSLGNKLSHTYTIRSSPDDTWKDGRSSKYAYSYDEEALILNREDYKGYPGELVLSYRSEYSYDEVGNLIRTLSYNWSGSDWTLSSKTESIFDVYGNIVDQTQFRWNNSEWIFNVRIVMEYDLLGHRLLYEVNLWDQEIGDWWTSDKETITYNMAQYQTSWTRSRRFMKEDEFESSQDNYFYNLVGKISKVVYSEWDVVSGRFDIYKKKLIRWGGHSYILYDSICEGENIYT